MKASKSCVENSLQSIITKEAFEIAVTSSRQLGKADRPGPLESFCSGGINVMDIATAPSAIQYLPGADLAPLYLCYYPQDVVTGNCATEYTTPPVQRFCPCDSEVC